MHSYPENWMEVRVKLTVSTKQKRGWDSELNWTERKSITLLRSPGPQCIQHTSTSHTAASENTKLKSVVFVWGFVTILQLFQMYEVRVMWTSRKLQMSAHVYLSVQNKQIKGQHKHRAKFRDANLLNGAASLSAQLIRQAYCCIISHGHTRCCCSNLFTGFSMHSSLILPLHRVSICLPIKVVDFLFSRSVLPA
jgi:hypothetical protein